MKSMQVKQLKSWQRNRSEEQVVEQEQTKVQEPTDVQEQIDQCEPAEKQKLTAACAEP